MGYTTAAPGNHLALSTSRAPLERGELDPTLFDMDELLRRLPPSFDLSRLPNQLQQQVVCKRAAHRSIPLIQISEGGPIDISLLPADMLRDFRQHNPDMAHVIDEALNRPNRPVTIGAFGLSSLLLKAIVTGRTERPPTTWRAPPYQRVAPYDISSVDRNSDLHLSNPAHENRIAMWTGVGLACIATLSVLTIAIMCYRRKCVRSKVRMPSHTKNNN